jgi:hypothetical protein
LFNTVTAFRHEMCLILGTFRLMRINRTASLMISIKNGDLNPFLRWSPLGRCARIMKPSLFLCWVSLRSKLHARTHTHILHIAGWVGSGNGCVEAKVMKALADLMNFPTWIMLH